MAKLMELDKQKLPEKVQWCKNCVVSNQRPRITFNNNGVCSACQWAYEKEYHVDWEKRERELVALLDKYRSRNGSFDVVVPASGGKDSCYVAHQLKHRYDMHPLCVTWSPFEYTGIGWKNFWNFNRYFTCILGMPQQEAHRKLALLSFLFKGDPWEPFTYGQKAWAFHCALRFKIPLIFYGENGELEYGGSEKYKYLPEEDPADFAEHYFKGSGIEQLLEAGHEENVIDDFNLALVHEYYRFHIMPPTTFIKRAGLRMHWMSYYHNWTPQENYYYAVEHMGFESNPEGRSEGTYTKWASLDDKMDGQHFQGQWYRMGMCRASRDAQQDIRKHHLTRDEGIALVRKYDGEFPKRHFDWMLDYLNIDEKLYWQVRDSQRERSNVWKKIDGFWRYENTIWGAPLSEDVRS